MKQLLQFRVSSKTFRFSVIIRCKIDSSSGTGKRVTYYAPKSLLRNYASRSNSTFLKKLAVTGTNYSVLRTDKNYVEKITQFLEEEFGNSFKVVIEDISGQNTGIGFRPNFSEPRALKKTVKKAKTSGSHMSIANNPIDRYKPLLEKEEWSNFTGDQVQRKPRPRMPEKVASKKLAVKKPTLKKKAMKKVDGGTTSGKVPVKKIAAKKAVAKKKVGSGATAKKASAKKVVAKKTAVKKVAAKKAKKDETVNNSDYNTIKVFYATDRKKTSPLSSEPYYSGKRNETNSLEYGNCSVSIPLLHKKGKIERPSWFRASLFPFPENPKLHISIIDLHATTQENFIADLMDKIGESTAKDAFIFIHGFNQTFEESVWRTAQIAHDLSFEGAPITYSWPSAGITSRKAYMTDEQNAQWTVPHLKDFLVEILSNPDLHKLHLLGHSMGTRVLTNAIIALKNSNPELIQKVNQIVLAAPDINSTLFIDTIAPAIYQSAQQITLYASSKDKALYWSTRYRSEDRRAGQSGEDIVIVNGVETVDASKVDCNFIGHSYFSEAKDLIDDIFHMFKHSFTPPERNLKPVVINNRGRYWMFPKSK